jgi:hypothetical protein
MGYYQGDFYAGARGDPFWGALLGIGKKVFSGVKGLLGGGHAGAMPGGSLTRTMAAHTQVMYEGAKRAIIKHPVLSAAGAAGALGALGGAGVERMMAPGAAAPKGYHLCKSMRGRHPRPCKTGEFVRNRHMNVCNPRALRRALRRAHGFTKLAMRTIHLVHPKKKARFGGFRRRKAKR